ncbi:MAG TPA: hypothetical protein VGM90_13910 [Kofleriaceae bacterium]|jgi:hypothetical protein
MRLVLASLALASLSPLADAKCMQPMQHPKVLNAGVTAPPDGGLLVMTSTEYGSNAVDEGEALQPTWVFKSGKKESKPETVVLAPGLVVYKLPAKVTSADLVGDKKSRGKITTSTKAIDLLPAPDVTSLETTSSDNMIRPETSSLVVLATAAPVGARALIVTDEGAAKTVLTFGLISPAGKAPVTDVVVYQQGHCSALPDGTGAPYADESVTVRYVDNFGRLSPPSKPIKVVAKKVK